LLEVVQPDELENFVEVVPPVERVLERMARDPQNIHTTLVVRQTTDMVNTILKISVPEPYRWNETVCSLTPGEIIMTCKLPPSAAWQMSSKYCQSETIYGLPNGIYGKVLDCVWQYILGSPDKEDLCRGLKQEMVDNVGMCAQGNLSRLCNILAGYVEGIAPQESAAEKMGRILPLMLEIDDDAERIAAINRELLANDIHQDEWLIWIGPLFEGRELTIEDDVLVIH